MTQTIADPYDVVPAPLRDIAREEWRAGRKAGTWMGGLLLVLGLGFAAYLCTYVASQSDGAFRMRGEELLPLLAALAVAAFGAYWLKMARRPDDVVAALSKPNAHIVWIYVSDVSTDRRRYKLMNLGLNDGQLLQLEIPDARATTIMTELAVACPEATLGYSEQHELAFRRMSPA